MIWQEHVPVVVMITRLYEKNKVSQRKIKEKKLNIIVLVEM